MHAVSSGSTAQCAALGAGVALPYTAWIVLQSPSNLLRLLLPALPAGLVAGYLAQRASNSPAAAGAVASALAVAPALVWVGVGLFLETETGGSTALSLLAVMPFAFLLTIFLGVGSLVGLVFGALAGRLGRTLDGRLVRRAVDR